MSLRGFLTHFWRPLKAPLFLRPISGASGSPLRGERAGPFFRHSEIRRIVKKILEVSAEKNNEKEVRPIFITQNEWVEDPLLGKYREHLHKDFNGTFLRTDLTPRMMC